MEVRRGRCWHACKECVNHKDGRSSTQLQEVASAHRSEARLGSVRWRSTRACTTSRFMVAGCFSMRPSCTPASSPAGRSTSDPLRPGSGRALGCVSWSDGGDGEGSRPRPRRICRLGGDRPARLEKRWAGNWAPRRLSLELQALGVPVRLQVVAMPRALTAPLGYRGPGQAANPGTL